MSAEKEKSEGEDVADEKGKRKNEEEKEGDEDVGAWTVKGLTYTLFTETTGHGIPRIVRARSWITRIFWTILFLAAMGIFMYNTYTVINTYLQYDVDIGTSVDFVYELNLVYI